MYCFLLVVQGGSLPGILHPVGDAYAPMLAVGSPVVRHGVRSLWGGENLKGSSVMVSTYFAETPYIFFSLLFSYMTALSTLENLLSGKKFYRIERVFFILELEQKIFLNSCPFKVFKGVSEYFAFSHSNTNDRSYFSAD